jgi:hypothetical protein
MGRLESGRGGSIGNDVAESSIVAGVLASLRAPVGNARSSRRAAPNPANLVHIRLSIRAEWFSQNS